MNSGDNFSQQRQQQQHQHHQQPQQRRETLQKQSEEDQSIYGIDLFLRCLYDYWLHGGMSFLIARKVTALFKTLTLFAIVVIVVYCIDYSALVSLSMGQDLSTVSSQTILHPPAITWFSMCWMIGCAAYFCYNAWKTINQLQQARNIRQFYRCNLNVANDEVLFWMPWSAVCRRLRKFQYTQWLAEKQQRRPVSSSEIRDKQSRKEKSHFQQQLFEGGESNNESSTGGEQSGKFSEAENSNSSVAEFEYEAMLTDDNIATMIMRRENYWIALFSDNILAFESDCFAEEMRNEDEPQRHDEFSAAFRHLRDGARDEEKEEETREERNQEERNQDDDDNDDEKTPINAVQDEMDHYPQREKRRRASASGLYFGNTVPSTRTITTFWRAAKERLVATVIRPLFITQCDRRQSTACVIEKPILTKTLQWCLTYGLFGFAIDSQTGALKHELTLFVEDANTFAERERKRSDAMFRSAAEWHRTNVSQPLTNSLIWRFRTMAIVGALLSPFIFVLVLLSFFFEHGDEVRNEPGRSLGARQWTNEARWAFRRYNELPHLFEARLARGALAAQQYVDSFLFATHGEYARCVSFVAAAALFVFLVLGAVGDEEALSLVQFALHRSAFWWITALTLVIAAARSMVPSIEAIRHETLRRYDNDTAAAAAEEPSGEESESNNDANPVGRKSEMHARNNSSAQFDVESNLSDVGAWPFLKPKTDDLPYNVLNALPNEFLPTPTPQELCIAVAHFTGYYPRSWQRQEHTEDVRKRFFCLFDSKWLIYLREILGILYTPYLLWYVFPKKAQLFLDFFVERTERQHKVGHVCAREQTGAVNASEFV